MAKNKVAIVIPIYKKQPTQEELISLQQAITILGNYSLILVCPNSLNIENYIPKYDHFLVERFEDSFFKSIDGYNKLMMSKQFYQRFLNYEYILIYQLDAYVFRDELEYWCNLNFDYIGAPWLYEKGGKLVISGIGNGGLSLRNTNKLLNYLTSKTIRMNLIGVYRLYANYPFIKKIIRFPKIVLSQLGYKNNKTYFINGGLNEDYLFGHISQYTTNRLKIPSEGHAIQFAFDEYPEELYSINKLTLPFGCHGWYKNKKARSFWAQHINQ